VARTSVDVGTPTDVGEGFKPTVDYVIRAERFPFTKRVSVWPTSVKPSLACDLSTNGKRSEAGYAAPD